MHFYMIISIIFAFIAGTFKDHPNEYIFYFMLIVTIFLYLYGLMEKE